MEITRYIIWHSSQCGTAPLGSLANICPVFYESMRKQNKKQTKQRKKEKKKKKGNTRKCENKTVVTPANLMGKI